VRAQQQALTSAQIALDLARRGYRGGASSVIQLLGAQRLRQLATLDLLKAEAERYNDTVRLFVVCGGGVTDNGQAANGG
jgi:outer membrane protein TolC